MSDIFVSFRNGDDPFAAALLFRALTRRFGPGSVFRSSESIPLGSRWAEEIWAQHASSAVLIAVIGPRWLTVADGAGRSRLHQPGDWVREEIATALAGGKLVIPVLLEAVARPEPAQLPADLAGLCALQAVRMDHRTIDTAVAALADRIAPLLAAQRTRSAAPASASAGAGAGAGAEADAWLDVWNLPARGRHFVERDELMRALRADLGGADSPAVVLHGPVGVGKTRLAVEYAHRYAGGYQLAWWISAVDPDLIPAQFAALAHACGFGDGGAVDAALPALFGQLRRRGRWLLVFDGAQDPTALAPYLAAAGPGCNVLITSRVARWGSLPVRERQVPGFTREQSASFLGSLLSREPAAVLDRLAEALDDLPLALAQAAAFLADCPLSATQYTDLLRTRAHDLLDRGETFSYPGSLAAAWSVGIERLESVCANGARLLEPLSVFAAAPVPFAFFSGATASPTSPESPASPIDPVPIAEPVTSDPIAFADAVKAVSRVGLVPVDDSAFQPGALFQAFVRGRLADADVQALREWARRAMARAPRSDPRAPQAWPEYAVLLPHVFALDPAASDDPRCRRLTLDAARHLVARADARTARALAADALVRWRSIQGPDAPDVLDAADHLAQACFQLGLYQDSVTLDEDVLARLTTQAGPDDPRTLTAAHNLAIDRWAAGVDRDRGRADFEHVVARRRAVLGADHPDTLRSVHNLALALRVSGHYAAARDLDTDNRARLADALGPDHLDTLRSAYATALDLRALGEHAQALELELDTLARLTATLGADHPDTLRSAYGAAVGLRETGNPGRARYLADSTYQRRRRVLGDSHADTLRSAYLLGTIMIETGDPDRGEPLCEQAGRGLLALDGAAPQPARS